MGKRYIVYDSSSGFGLGHITISNVFSSIVAIYKDEKKAKEHIKNSYNYSYVTVDWEV